MFKYGGCKPVSLKNEMQRREDTQRFYLFSQSRERGSSVSAEGEAMLDI